jgi:hypothetical protein
MALFDVLSRHLFKRMRKTTKYFVTTADIGPIFEEVNFECEEIVFVCVCVCVFVLLCLCFRRIWQLFEKRLLTSICLSVRPPD